jgi:methionyl-tRNA synthetase
MISFAQFKSVELKSATVLEAERVEGTDKLLKMQIDIGGEQRQIVAGIAETHSPEALIGKSIAVVTNLQPAKIRGVESNGMLLAAVSGDDIVLVTFEKDVAPGTPIS